MRCQKYRQKRSGKGIFTHNQLVIIRILLVIEFTVFGKININEIEQAIAYSFQDTIDFCYNPVFLISVGSLALTFIEKNVIGQMALN